MINKKKCTSCLYYNKYNCHKYIRYKYTTLHLCDKYDFRLSTLKKCNNYKGTKYKRTNINIEI